MEEADLRPAYQETNLADDVLANSFRVTAGLLPQMSGPWRHAQLAEAGLRKGLLRRS